MAKKKIDPIETLGRDTDKLTVQKSKPLFALWQSKLTLAEFKILDTYLGRINSHDDGHRTVKFGKGELEELLGVKQLKPQVLDDRLKHLMTTVRIPDEDSKRGFTRISLFEKAHAEQDDYGVWEVELTCTESAKKYIFDVENITYLRYKLKNIINIKSRYTYIMFLYLWDNKYKRTWEIGLSELKAMLNCENEEYCSQFKVFNDRVLKRVQNEIHEVTDIRYDYETVKRGRSVVAVRFTYKPLDLPMADPNQVSFDDIETAAAADERDGAVWEDALEPLQLTNEQLDGIQAHLVLVDPSKLPELPQFGNDIELRRYHYLAIKVAEMGRREGIKDKYAYLIGILRHDAADSRSE